MPQLNASDKDGKSVRSGISEPPQFQDSGRKTEMPSVKEKRFLTRSPRAFSLIENMVAMVIVSTGSIATMNAIIDAQVRNKLEHERARAHEIISGYMEQSDFELFTTLVSGTTITVWDNGTPEEPGDDTLGVLTVSLTDPVSGQPLTVIPDPVTMVIVEVSLEWHPRGRLADRLMRETAMAYMAP